MASNDGEGKADGVNHDVINLWTLLGLPQAFAFDAGRLTTEELPFRWKYLFETSFLAPDFQFNWGDFGRL